MEINFNDFNNGHEAAEALMRKCLVKGDHEKTADNLNKITTAAIALCAQAVKNMEFAGVMTQTAAIMKIKGEIEDIVDSMDKTNECETLKI